MTSGLLTTRTEIYSGADLEKAFTRSRIAKSRKSVDLPRLSSSLGQFVSDVRNADISQIIPRSCQVEGRERNSGDAMTLLFAGTLRSVDFCSSAILGHQEYSKHYAEHPVDDTQPDVVVTDHPLVHRRFRSLPAIVVPQWIKQRVPLGDDWNTTLNRIPGSLRKQTARLLASTRYRVRLASSLEAKRRFYDTLHVPYLRSRHGNRAKIPSVGNFVRDAAAHSVLELHHDDTAVAGVTIAKSRNALVVKKSGQLLGRDDLPRRSDLLDYFCLLLAQMTECSFLDLGHTRPHLEDGLFRNKSKWRPRVVCPSSHKTDIRISPTHASANVLGFLVRNYFIQRFDGNVGIRLMENDDSPRSIDYGDLCRLSRNAGLDRVVVESTSSGSLSPGNNSDRNGVEYVQLNATQSSLAEYLDRR